MRRVALSLALVFVVTVPANACLWDYDTLRSERLRFPSTLELMTGKFLRHSVEFYRWRDVDRTKRLALPENQHRLELVDDLAVAKHKLGDNKRAIQLMLESLTNTPNRYETLANLGTFYMLDGQFATGRNYIEKALEINPNAHFGRERYQKLLADYVLLRSLDGRIKLPLFQPQSETDSPNSQNRSPAHSDKQGTENLEVAAAKTSIPPKFAEGNFADFVLLQSPLARDEQRQNPVFDERSRRQQLTDAIRGVLGMMRFADYKSPILLEVLGDLLHGTATSHDIQFDARLLAARAYLLASQQANDGNTRRAYRLLANSAVRTHPHAVSDPERDSAKETTDFVANIESELQREIAEADRWFENIRTREHRWIDSGTNVDVEFSRHYYREPEIVHQGLFGPLMMNRLRTYSITCIGLFVVVGLIARYRRKRSRHSRALAQDGGL